MSKSLVVQNKTDIDTMTLGKILAQSGYFRDASDQAKAVVKVLAGREMGFGPIAAMTGVHIIQGAPSVGANLMAAAVKRHPRYGYRIVHLDDDGCTIIFFQDGKEIGTSAFTREDAGRAGVLGKDNWKKYPRNMMFARAISNGVRWFCPDVFEGVTVYTPDELGAEVNDSGDVIDVTPRTLQQDDQERKANGNGTPGTLPRVNLSPQLVREARKITTKNGTVISEMDNETFSDLVAWLEKSQANIHKNEEAARAVSTLLSERERIAANAGTWLDSELPDGIIPDLFESLSHAFNALSRSWVISPSDVPDQILAWARHYRGSRDLGENKHEAVAFADSKVDDGEGE